MAGVFVVMFSGGVSGGSFEFWNTVLEFRGVLMLVLIVFGLGGLVFWPLLHYACRQACGEPLGGREVASLRDTLSE